MSSLEQQQEMTLTLCITGFCFAEAGKNTTTTVKMLRRNESKVPVDPLGRIFCVSSNGLRKCCASPPCKFPRCQPSTGTFQGIEEEGFCLQNHSQILEISFARF